MKPTHLSSSKNAAIELPDVTQVVLEHSLWWCLTQRKQAPWEVSFALSKPFARRLPCEVSNFEAFTHCLKPESQTMLSQKLEALRESPEQEQRFLMGFDTDHSTVWVMAQLHYQFDVDVESICANCVEVSELHALEEELVASNSRLMIERLKEREAMAQKQADLLQQEYQAQTQFLAMLSHELRSPLMGVNGLVDLIKQNYLQQKPIGEPLQVMRLTIDQLNFLINDILTFSQTQSDQIQLQNTVFDIQDLAHYIQHLTKSIAVEKGLKVDLHLDTQHQCFFGDVVRTSQVLVNLMVNAIKFTEEGGVSLVIEQPRNTKGVRIYVRDSGPGISESDLVHIFDPYKQLDAKGKRKYVGSGLGLSIVKNLVELMQGQVHVHSQLGQGATFEVWLPFEGRSCKELEAEETSRFRGFDTQKMDEAVTASSHSTMAEDKARAQVPPCRVLIADDSIINRQVLASFLQEAHCDVTQAEDGDQAWSLFQQASFEFVFLDIQMPGLNGMEVCQKIRALPEQACPQLKGVFALTAAHTQWEEAQLGVVLDKSQFDQWLEKPVSQDKVIHALKCFHQENATQRSFAQSEKTEIEIETEADTKSEDTQKPTQAGVATDAWLAQNEQAIAAWTPQKNVPEHLQAMVPQFQQALVEDLAQLQSAWAEQAFDAFSQALHHLKGNVMLFQVTPLLEVIEQLQQAKRAHGAQPSTFWPLAKKWLDHLEKLIQRLH